MMTFFWTFIFLVSAGLVGGLLQSTAGLASLATYPALLAAGLPPVIANVTNTTGLIFSGFSSILSSTKELKHHGKQIAVLVILALVGSIGGSALLLIAPATSFEKAVPFFILAAGILLLVSGRRPNTAKNTAPTNTSEPRSKLVAILSGLGILFVGAYTGYFGAAAGVISLALLSLVTTEQFLVVNAMKNVIAFTGNFVATVIFIFRAHIEWLYVLPLGIGLFIGGYLGPIIVRHVNVALLRLLIALAAFGLASYLFVTAYF
ncbi:integral membrane protein [Agrilactobacillus composti DSM 18527 = JCM 14202]|uniref:Probable membrane transporter protein n=2 Tax=Agrilactobacillus TaxID=2767875 RepID=X0PPE8_9LACO|nr:integral membrane protein [Agrilactobacillus composti DSM 18527 = JCM 14202]GAF38881.1 membrane protein [Agrilactobacillus composti DSM 18527 = JCM 14202]